MRIAVIDLGTNTFNLLIASAGNNGRYQTELSSKHPVKLGKGGINSQTILPEAMERGLVAFQTLMHVIERRAVDKIFAFATSAFRSATNGPDLVRQIREKYGVEVEIISGEREAELIYRGVSQVVDLSTEKHLIMDIGGGSNELIIANKNEIFFKQSFPLGMSRLLEQFTPSDPIKPSEIGQIVDYLETELRILFDAAAIHKPQVLVGSSGSFDTYRAVLSNGNDRCIPPSQSIDMNAYLQLHQRLLTSTTKERMAMPGMEPMRVEMIVVASIFTHFVIKKTGISRIIQSCYALKEGAMWDIIQSNSNTSF